MTELVTHHTHYFEIHDFDAIIEMPLSEHKRLSHRKLFPEVTKKELKKISNRAHGRTEKGKSAYARYHRTKKGKVRAIKSEACIQHINFSESFKDGIRLQELIRYNHKTGSVYYTAYFRVSQGNTLLIINLK